MYIPDRNLSTFILKEHQPIETFPTNSVTSVSHIELSWTMVLFNHELNSVTHSLREEVLDCGQSRQKANSWPWFLVSMSISDESASCFHSKTDTGNKSHIQKLFTSWTTQLKLAYIYTLLYSQVRYSYALYSIICVNVLLREKTSITKPNEAFYFKS